MTGMRGTSEVTQPIGGVALAVGASGDATALAVGGGLAQVAFQELPGTDWTGWGALADAPTTFLAAVSAAAAPQGGLVAAAVGTDRQVYAIEAPDADGWPASWAPVPGAGADFSAGCAVTVTGNGTAVVVAVGGDGTLWSASRPAGDDTWSPWASCGSPVDGVLLTGSCDVTTVAGEQVLAAAAGADGGLWTLSGTAPSWDATWSPAGQPATVTIEGPVAVTAAGPAPGAVVVGADAQAYVTDLGGTFTSLGQPAGKALVTGGATSAGMGWTVGGGRAVLLAAVDGLAYGLAVDAAHPVWQPMDPCGDLVPLRGVTGTGPYDYVACVLAPAAALRGDRRPGPLVPLKALRLGSVVTSGTAQVNVPAGARFVLAALQNAEGVPVPGVGLAVTTPHGSPIDRAHPPSSDGLAVGIAGGLVTYLLMTDPPAGTWTVTVDGATGSTDDFQATFTTLPSVDVQQTVQATLRTMVSEDAAASAWGCTACKFGVYVGAGVLAAAIAAGLTLLGPESAVIVWLAEFTGLSQEAALKFVATLVKENLTSVPQIVNAICGWTGACS
jgi:hypothetical protein